MKRTEFQKILKLKSRQHVDNVLAGRGNLILWRARLAVDNIGGELETWMDAAKAEERLALFNGLNKKKWKVEK